VAASCAVPDGFQAHEREALEGLRREIAAAQEVMEEIPELAQAISALTLAILKPDLQAARAA